MMTMFYLKRQQCRKTMNFKLLTGTGTREREQKKSTGTGTREREQKKFYGNGNAGTGIEKNRSRRTLDHTPTFLYLVQSK